MDSIRHANIALLSEMNFIDSVIRAAVLQTMANNENAQDKSQKNTFLFRFLFFICLEFNKLSFVLISGFMKNRFSVDADLNFIKIQNQFKFRGAGHLDDLCYIFHCHVFDQNKLYDIHLRSKDAIFDIIMRMVKIITNFARNG